MSVKIITIGEEQAGQRIDNFLFKTVKGVPKSRLYKAIRRGEVRVNKGRIGSHYRLQVGDELRLPPLRVAQGQPPATLSAKESSHYEAWIMLENRQFILLNKPSGIPVHGGSGLNGGLIERLRLLRPQQSFLELVHRLDRDTSGCLLVAKKRSSLLALQQQWQQKQLCKHYLALVKGHWPKRQQQVKLALRKNVLQSGERMVVVDQVHGKPCFSRFRPIAYYADATLVEATPVTGRTHQLRVHAAALGHPIAGDIRYGDKNFNKQMQQKGLKRLFLHAAELSFELDEQNYAVCALLDPRLWAILRGMSRCP